MECKPKNASGEQLYFLATLENCPIDALDLQGVVFPRRTMIRGTRRDSAGGDVDVVIGMRKGGLSYLSDAKAKETEQLIAEHVVRWRGKSGVSKDGVPFNPHGQKGDVIRTTNPNVGEAKDREGKPEGPVRRPTYRPEPQDFPLAQAIAFKPVHSVADAPEWFSSEPTSYESYKAEQDKKAAAKKAATAGAK